MKKIRCMNAHKAALIKRMRIDFPDLFQYEIADKVGVDTGRVSEVLNGKTYSKVKPASSDGGSYA